MANQYNGHNTDEFDDDPKVEDSGGLDALFQGVYSSVVEAQNVIEQHYLEEVTKDYFDEEGKPKMITLTLPASNGEMKPTMIPAITLVPHNGLSIKEVEIEMQVALSMGDPKPAPKKGFLRRLGTDMSNRNKGKEMAKIRVVFNGNAPPEGLARIKDQLIKLLPS
jgi:hypothetical protein